MVTSFTTNISAGNIKLDFTIEDTENIQSLDIEKSTDGTSFSRLATI